MTIQKAIKSRKPFRRKEWKFYLEIKMDESYCFFIEGTDDTYDLCEWVDVLADDWEVKNDS